MNFEVHNVTKQLLDFLRDHVDEASYKERAERLDISPSREQERLEFLKWNAINFYLPLIMEYGDMPKEDVEAMRILRCPPEMLWEEVRKLTIQRKRWDIQNRLASRIATHVSGLVERPDDIWGALYWYFICMIMAADRVYYNLWKGYVFPYTIEGVLKI